LMADLPKARSDRRKLPRSWRSFLRSLTKYQARVQWTQPCLSR
jgi:hypothetical protein